MADPTDEWGRPSRRERRLISFLAPQLQANEQIEFILSLVREVPEDPTWLPDPTFAVVVTNHRVFIISLQHLTDRPQTTGTAMYPCEGVTASWTRDAEFFGGYYSGARWMGTLSITSPFGTRDLWVDGEPERIALRQ